MRIEVDTKKDTKEEISELIGFLHRLRDMSSAERSTISEDDSQDDSEGITEMAGMAAARDLFGNQIEEDDEKPPEVRSDKDEEAPDVEIVQY
ncbi:MAG: hypothetical protein KJ709_06610 [Nanoarchaeota archaeon]|nr:hypothetical protein [Nanoarchaeota archaeon]